METFTCKDGRVVELEWDDDEMLVYTTGDNRDLVGNMTFLLVDGADPGGSQDYWLVTNMHLEGPGGSRSYVNQGIGRAILQSVAEMDIPIVFTPIDAGRNDRGSHLTDMGPEFARRMVKAGLAHWDDCAGED